MVTFNLQVPKRYPRYPAIVHQKQSAPDPGLCAGCQHMRVINSDRGSTFYMCRKSLTDPTFPKYPRLPVVECRGYEPKPK